MYLCVFCTFLSVRVLSVHFLSNILLVLQLIDDGDETVPSEDKKNKHLLLIIILITTNLVYLHAYTDR